MKKILSFMISLLFVLQGYAQKMTVKDSDDHILMEVNDEGSVGSITVPSGSSPGETTDKLYNVDGALYWNGSALGMSGSAGGWTTGVVDVITGLISHQTKNPMAITNKRSRPMRRMERWRDISD